MEDFNVELIKLIELREVDDPGSELFIRVEVNLEVSKSV